MMSLFSSFDLMLFYWSYYFFVSLSFGSLTVVYKNSIWSKIKTFILQENMIKFFYSLKSKSFNKIFAVLIISIMFLITLMNIFSVFPFTFPICSQFGTMMSISLCFWAALMAFSFVSNLKGFLSHFVPEGAPILLVLFLFLIEVVSNVIRPLTLSVRLVANILAGHLLMILLSKLVFSFSFSFGFYLILNMVEILVGVIQAYIFATMLTLYFAEIH